MRRGVVFSAEGAALDLERPWRTAVLQAWGDVIGQHLDPEEISEIVPLGPRALFKERLGRVKGRLAFDTFIGRFEKAVRPSAAVVPGFVEGAERLRAAGRRVALVSRLNRRCLGFATRAVGLADAADAVLAEEDLPDYPPDPSAVLLACARLSLAPEEILLVSGDAGWRAAGRLAGADVAAVRWTSMAGTDGSLRVKDFVSEYLSQG